MDSNLQKDENAYNALGFPAQNLSKSRSGPIASLAEALIIIFICEAAITMLLQMMEFSHMLESILNPTLLVLAVGAVLYRLILKPINELLEKTEKSESGLDLFKHLIEQSNDSIFIVNPETAKILYANYRACVTLGYNLSELLKMTLRDIGENTSDDCAWGKYIGKVRNFGNRMMERYKRKDGSFFAVEVNASIVRLYRRDYMVAVVRDTIDVERAKAKVQEDENKVRKIAECANDAIVIMGPKGEITFWNSAAQGLFGYTTGEATGKQMHTLLIPGRFRDAYQKGFAAFQKTGQGKSIDKTLKLSALRKDGNEISVELNVSAACLGGQWHAIALIRDISKNREPESDLAAAAQIPADSTSL